MLKNAFGPPKVRLVNPRRRNACRQARVECWEVWTSLMSGAETIAARRLPESYEAFVWNDIAIGKQPIPRGLYLVEVLVSRRGAKEGALLSSLDTESSPVRLTRSQYELLIGTAAFERR